MHKLEIFDVLEKMKSRKEGLNENEVLTRQKDGLNKLDEVKHTSIFIKFLLQFKDILIIILLAAAIISFLVDRSEWIESIIIFAIVLLNAILGVFQETKAEKSLEALKKLSTPKTKVLRNNEVKVIDSVDLVVGDIVLLEAGDFVPADGRIIENSKLTVDESALTGESKAVVKESEAIHTESVSIGDQLNMVFSSTFIVFGHAKMVVTKTGMNTEIGKIAKILGSTKETLTPLQKKLNQIGKMIGLAAILICIVVFFLEVISSNDILSSFKNSIALAVAAIPEGLATVVTVVLAIGVEKMSHQNAIIKKLPAVETLGAATVVASDKTGTLTENKMTVVKICADDIKDIDTELTEKEKLLLSYFAICSDAIVKEKNGVEETIGDPTEVALINANNKYGLYKDEQITAFRRVADLAFDSNRKMMSVVISDGLKYYVITKGAVDKIITRSDASKSIVTKQNTSMANEALRVLAVGYKELSIVPTAEQLNSEFLECDLTYLGLVGMIDPARKEAKASIEEAKKAGIKVVMITGDHIDTAVAIAKNLGIISSSSEAITSSDLHKLSDEEFKKSVYKYGVYARVNPEDKVRIVDTFKANNEIVAMTGDGVNDSPALKKADIGVAMGITGTDVAKEAASMILTDDNFSTIIVSIKEGRNIYQNIKKTVEYLLSSNIGEVITIFLASLLSALFASLNFGIPLLSIHLLWINLITDSLPAFSLGMEKSSDEVMNEKPRDPKSNFFDRIITNNIVLNGIFIGLITLVAYIIGHYQSKDTYLGQTMAFFTLATIQLLHAFNVKSHKSIFSKSTFNNKFLNGSFLIGITLQLVIIYVAPLANIFNLVSLNFTNLLICIGLSLLIILKSEISKLIRAKKR